MTESVETNVFDQREIHTNCTVEIWSSSATGEVSIGWYENKPSGTYQCFHCLSNSVVWSCDYDFDDLGYEGSEIVHICHCENCGAEIEYRIEIEGSDEDD